jgi:hypothetical protein
MILMKNGTTNDDDDDDNDKLISFTLPVFKTV